MFTEVVLYPMRRSSSSIRPLDPIPFESPSIKLTRDSAGYVIFTRPTLTANTASATAHGVAYR